MFKQFNHTYIINLNSMITFDWNVSLEDEHFYEPIQSTMSVLTEDLKNSCDIYNINVDKNCFKKIGNIKADIKLLNSQNEVGKIKCFINYYQILFSFSDLDRLANFSYVHDISLNDNRFSFNDIQGIVTKKYSFIQLTIGIKHHNKIISFFRFNTKINSLLKCLDIIGDLISNITYDLDSYGIVLCNNIKDNKYKSMKINNIDFYYKDTEVDNKKIDWIINLYK